MEEQHRPTRRQRCWSPLPYCALTDAASGAVGECAAAHLLPVTERLRLSNRGHPVDGRPPEVTEEMV